MHPLDRPRAWRTQHKEPPFRALLPLQQTVRLAGKPAGRNCYVK